MGRIVFITLLADEPDKTLIRNRQINKRLRINVFKRDNFSCRTCGRDASDDDPFSFGRKIKLHLGHINSLIGQIRGKNELVSELTEDTAITQCNVCNEGFQDDDIPFIDWEKKLRNLKMNFLNYLIQNMRWDVLLVPMHYC